MELTYIQNGDYLIPNLIAPKEPKEMLTKYGILRRDFLKNHHRGVYSAMRLRGTLKSHCLTIQEQAIDRMEAMTEKMAKTEGVTEALKAQNQMLWVQKMESIRSRAEEVVLHDLVYSL